MPATQPPSSAFFGVQDLGFLGLGLGCRVWGLRFGFRGFIGSRVQGLGLRWLLLRVHVTGRAGRGFRALILQFGVTAQTEQSRGSQAKITQPLPKIRKHAP